MWLFIGFGDFVRFMTSKADTVRVEREKVLEMLEPYPKFFTYIVLALLAVWAAIEGPIGILRPHFTNNKS